MISVLIATKDRSQKLKLCLQSLIKNKFNEFEVLILDQSQNGQTKKMISDFKNKKLKYYHLDFTNKSKALNFGLKKSKGDLIAFTDDDCVVTSNWLKEINFYFNLNEGVDVVFGKTLAYFPKKHLNLICPAIFNKTTPTKTTDPGIIFCLELGQGNNMSFRRKVLLEFGGFHESFGPGARIVGGEDVELIYRLLYSKSVLAYSPKISLYHNRWLSSEREQKLSLQYTLTTCAAATYCFKKFKDNRIFNLFEYKLREHFCKKRFSTVMFNHFFAICKGVYLGLTSKTNDFPQTL